MDNLKGNRLTGKNVVVTGAGSRKTGYGIGQAISILFASQGAKILVVDSDKDRGDRTVSKILNNGDIASLCLADVSKSCLLYTSPSPRDLSTYRMPSSA